MGVLGSFWLQVGGLGVILGSKLGGLGAIMAESWGALGHLVIKLGSWVLLVSKLESLWGSYGAKWGGLEAILAPSWRILVPFWLQVGGSGLQVGGFWSNHSSKLDVKLTPPCHFAELLKT